MKRKITKLVALIIGVLMLTALLPTMAFAADNPSPNVLNGVNWGIDGDTGMYIIYSDSEFYAPLDDFDFRWSQRVIVDNGGGSFVVELVVRSGAGLDSNINYYMIDGERYYFDHNSGVTIVMGAMIAFDSYTLISGNNSTYDPISGELRWYPSTGTDTLEYQIQMVDSALDQGFFPINVERASYVMFGAADPGAYGGKTVGVAGLFDSPLVQMTTVNTPDPADYTALDAALQAAADLDEEDYTAESWAVLAAAVEAAEAITRDLTSLDQVIIDEATTAILTAIDDLVENPSGPIFITGVSGAKFISIVETAKNSRVWLLTFEVTIEYSDGSIAVERYVIELKGNNANQDGEFIFGTDHDLAGYTLTYDIKGNGSNIKAFSIK